MTRADLAEALRAYGALLSGMNHEPQAMPSGFSGARVWKLQTLAGSWCLRAAAPFERLEHLHERHHLMRVARQAGRHFVPLVLALPDGRTVVQTPGCQWELLEWRSGKADFRQHPSLDRLRAAATALGHLHRIWEKWSRSCDRYPAIERRLEACARRIESGRWPGPLRSIGERLTARVQRWLSEVPALLRGCATSGLMQPCLRDVWHEHLLYEGEVLTGIVDYASMGLDSVATDLARMFGSLVGDDEDRWQIGLEAYRRVRPLTQEEERLARQLDRTGVIVAMAHWLEWLNGAEVGQELGRALERIEEIERRVEGWSFRR